VQNDKNKNIVAAAGAEWGRRNEEAKEEKGIFGKYGGEWHFQQEERMFCVVFE
jgi:hypothetical protein